LFDVKPPDYSDAGNANRFSVYFTGLVAFSDGLGWLNFNGKYWERGEHAVIERAITMTEDMVINAMTELRDMLHVEADAKMAVKEELEGAAEKLKKARDAVKDAKAYHAHALRSRNASRIMGMLELAKHSLVVSADQLDADPLLLNTPSGIIDLKTGDLTRHNGDSPFLFCTHMTAVSPSDEGAKMWLDFLDTITCGDESLAGFLQLVVGMAAVGAVYQEGIIIANGNGRNGKSTFFNTVSGVLGDYAGTIDARVLTTERQNKGAALATLRGKRLVIAAELEEHQRLSTSTLKQLASTDMLTIEEKFKQPETVKQTHTLVLHTNHLPRVGSTDNGTWRRLIVVPFNAVIPESSGIQNYAEKLVKEAGPAILTWIIIGAQNFIRNGFKLDFPDAVVEATEEYRQRENWLENFISERCVREPNARVNARELYLEYKDWAEENGEYIRRENDFSAAMETVGYQKIAPKNRKTWVGLRLGMEGNLSNPYATTA